MAMRDARADQQRLLERPIRHPMFKNVTAMAANQELSKLETPVGELAAAVVRAAGSGVGKAPCAALGPAPGCGGVVVVVGPSERSKVQTPVGELA